MQFCSVEGCPKTVVARTWCATHYKRWKRYGDPHRGRPEHWGKAEKHPLWHSHQYFKRLLNGLSPEWQNLWVFIEAVGERPEKCNLQRIDQTKPIGPGNFYWKPTLGNEDKAEYQRKWAKANPEKVKNQELKRRFGITLSEYIDMATKQNNVCAICKQKDPHFENLAVDHCHKTGKIRGLLCHLCNRAIGYFKDDIDSINHAIIYLKQSS